MFLPVYFRRFFSIFESADFSACDYQFNAFCLCLYCILHLTIDINLLHRKEVIQPHLPIRLPCYDLTPIIDPTFGCCLLSVSSQTSGVSDSHGLTGGVYKARERIHRGMLIRDY